MRLERLEQAGDAALGERLDDDDLRLPGVGRRRAAQPQHLAHLARRLRGERQVALADGQHVGDLERARLQRLDVVAEPGRADDDAVSARAAMRVSDWPVPTVSTMTRSKPAGVEAVDRGARRARQAAELAARRERADEGVRMGAVLAHADPVAEHGAAADRARRIEGDDGDL